MTTQTAAVNGSGVAISGITGDWTLKLQIASISDTATTPSVRFQFTDTVNNFTASLAGPTFSVQGALSNSADIVYSWKKKDFPDLRFGVASAQIRLDLTNIDATATTSYHAWAEY
jgi:hypothetical protein